ncbi:MAG TPA: AAA family ATPase, partial [Polyangia bacterium]
MSVSRFPDRRVIEKAEREWSLRSELDPTFALVPLALVSEQGRPVLVLADPGGGPLTTQLARAWTVTRMIGFAISLAQAIGRVHAANLIHKDIKPANVWVDSAGEAKLTGFGIATRLPRERQTPEPPQTIVGTLAYMSPEQTGRMNRSLDSRSDLYSLGATLYELVTGVLPFAASDPMEWVHSHVARQPVPPADRFETAPVWRPEPIPRQLSDIIVRLLAKAAEDRYQTAAGVAADLARCLEQWEREGRIGAFVLGERDAASRLLMPEKLYGREAETRRLLEAFDRVVKTGVSELVLVTGYSGIGKSALVNELHKVIVLPRGLYAAGKFDQYKRNVLYDTLAQAGRSLVQQLLGKSETEVARWRSAITQAVGDHGQLIVDLIPELEALIGKQPAVPPLSFQEAEHRFHGVFRAFLRVFARKEHPLALFLDDLQWHDSASLKLLESLITDPELRHLLLIGAYRDREVDPSHPLTRTLEVIAKSHTRISELVLRPLSRSDLQRLLADALHCDKAHVEGLAKLVHDKTAGNPFFATQLIASLHDEQLLFFDAATGVWRWDMERIREKRFSDNVADLMVGKLERLPTATREVLKVFACLGNTIDAPTLAKAHGKTEAETQRDLWESIKAGFTLPVGGTHRFLHDRIREAAFSLIPEA